MSEAENNVLIEREGKMTEVPLAALLGVDMSEVKEVRSLLTPAGKFHWLIKDAVLKSVEATNKDDPQGDKVAKPVVQFELEAVNCLSLVDPDLDVEDYIGKQHNHSFWINKLKIDLGRVKAFLSDAGLDANKPLQELLDEAHGTEFFSSVTNVKNKENPDIVYANLKDVESVEKFNEKHGGAETQTNASGGGLLS